MFMNFFQTFYELNVIISVLIHNNLDVGAHVMDTFKMYLHSITIIIIIIIINILAVSHQVVFLTCKYSFGFFWTFGFMKGFHPCFISSPGGF